MGFSNKFVNMVTKNAPKNPLLKEAINTVNNIAVRNGYTNGPLMFSLLKNEEDSKPVGYLSRLKDGLEEPNKPDEKSQARIDASQGRRIS